MEPIILLSKTELVTVQGPGNKPITLEISLQVRMTNDENRSATATSEVHAVERGDIKEIVPIAWGQREPDEKQSRFGDLQNFFSFQEETDSNRSSPLNGDDEDRGGEKTEVKEEKITPVQMGKVGCPPRGRPDMK